ncbi:MAG: glycosyltransferase, partial [Candidatus Rokuibacteriota bacterium]
ATAPMRVMMLAPTPFFGDRGCHVRILEEARALRGRGVEVLVGTYHVGKEVSEVPTFRIPALGWIRRLPVGFSIHKPYLDLLLLVAARRAARRFRPDILHGHLHEGAVLAAILGRRLRRPIVADLQGSLTGELIDHGHLSARGPIAALGRGVERAILRRPTRILASSAAFARELSEQWGVPADRIVPLPDGVDPDAFRPGLPTDDLRARLGVVGKRVVVYLGVLTPYQGVDDLLAAWPGVVQAVPNAHLLLMGYPNEDRYGREVARRGLAGSVTLTGRIAYGEAPRYLGLGEVAVSPKRSTTEANGKLLNYMACALPTVAYDGPVSRELLGEAGVRVPLGDTAALAAACAGLLADAGDRKRRGEALRERAVAEYSWPALGGRLVDAYRACR